MDGRNVSARTTVGQLSLYSIVACYRTNRKLHSKCDSVTCHAILVELF